MARTAQLRHANVKNKFCISNENPLVRIFTDCDTLDQNIDDRGWSGHISVQPGIAPVVPRLHGMLVTGICPQLRVARQASGLT